MTLVQDRTKRALSRFHFSLFPPIAPGRLKTQNTAKKRKTSTNYGKTTSWLAHVPIPSIPALAAGQTSWALSASLINSSSCLIFLSRNCQKPSKLGENLKMILTGVDPKFTTNGCRLQLTSSMDLWFSSLIHFYSSPAKPKKTIKNPPKPKEILNCFSRVNCKFTVIGSKSNFTSCIDLGYYSFI